MGAFSMVIVENMDMKDVQKLEEKFSEVEHVKDVLWYDDVTRHYPSGGDGSEKYRKVFINGDAIAMMLVLFDNTTSSDTSMEAITELRKIANEQCFFF